MKTVTSRAFLPLWTVAILATAAAFVLHLALRGKTVSLGYELGRARAEQARLREVKRVLVPGGGQLQDAGARGDRRADPPGDGAAGARADRAALGAERGRRSADEAAVKNLDPKRARWIRLRMGILCGVMGLGARGNRLGRLPRSGGGRRRAGANGREAAPAPPPHRAEARHHLRPQRHGSGGEHRGPERQRRRRRDASWRRRKGRAGRGAEGHLHPPEPGPLARRARALSAPGEPSSLRLDQAPHLQRRGRRGAELADPKRRTPSAA